MDMHQMTFPDNRFDLIYCAHSLEHAYDVQKVVTEIRRVSRSGAIVVIEVPVHYETRGADLIDFADCDTLHGAFEPYCERVLWCEEQEPVGLSNHSSKAVVRTVFSLK